VRDTEIHHVGLRTARLVPRVAGLGRIQRLVLVAIASYANVDGEGWPSEATLAAGTDLTVRSISAAIRALERLGVLKVERRGHHQSNVYRIQVGALDALPPVGRQGRSQFHPGAPVRVENDGGQGGKRRPAGWKPVPPKRTRKGDKEEVGPPTPRRGVVVEPVSPESAEDDSRLWLDLLNRAAGTGFRADDPANLRPIARLIRRGYTLADAERVAASRAAKWSGTERAEFLRPSTVFGSKFGAYLEAARNGRGLPDPLRVNRAWDENEA
jgi:uncharacterized phage protein (TIGR02220 family)